MSNKVVKIIPNERVLTIAGLETSGNEDGVFSIAKLNNPIDIKINKYGIINVLDKNSGNIRSINIGLQKNILQDVIPNRLLTLRATTGNTLSQEITDFPNLHGTNSWKLSINFNWNGGGSWNAIIGNMYNSSNWRGWGLWRSTNGYLHWGGKTQTTDLNTLVIQSNTNYRIIAKRYLIHLMLQCDLFLLILMVLHGKKQEISFFGF